jgi:4-hydroxy-2-oxoheptanedioate aldolase
MAPKLDREEPEILKIYERLLKETSKRGIAAGLHNGTAGYAKRMIDMGFKLVTIANDVGLMVQASRAAVKEARGEGPGLPPPDTSARANPKTGATAV